MSVLSRRQFLTADLQRRRAGLSPPWAADRDEFFTKCTRCGRCIERCPERILESSPRGYPRINFESGGCTFCGECVTACSAGALRLIGKARPWDLKAWIETRCLALHRVECRVCAERCEAAAIRLHIGLGKVAIPAVDEDRCIGCGDCVAACPAAAIRIAPLEMMSAERTT